jgi:hypothetical protein
MSAVILGRRVGIIGCLLGLLLLPAASPASGPTLHIVVLQDEGKLEFEFYGDPPFPGAAQPPLPVYRMTIHGPGGAPVFWEIETAGKATVAHVTYGIVPPGFRQLIPSTANAPSLRRNENYRVTATAGAVRSMPFTYGQER